MGFKQDNMEYIWFYISNKLPNQTSSLRSSHSKNLKRHTYIKDISQLVMCINL